MISITRSTSEGRLEIHMILYFVALWIGVVFGISIHALCDAAKDKYDKRR